jgi:predicted alpha/beta hydrolase family esterase
MKRAIIVHQWSGSPTSDWYPWLKSELEKLGFSVIVPVMPRPDEPNIIDWTQALDAAVGLPDERTILIGHSVGCQTILRYVSRLPATMRLGGAVLVTPWLHLLPAALETEADQTTAKPWLETPIEWSSAKNILSKVVACFSDDDPYVPSTRRFPRPDNP